ncbi:MerR family transcriptional regulator [Syntrophomonas wolfei]|nr:MerR family transcriptional regulator [Syntrophomonas wolfei]
MLTIGEFSKISRVSTKTLRYYDQIGLLKPGFVSKDSGYRYYEVSQLRDMLLITRLKRYRFSLPEISAVLATRDNSRLGELLQAKKEEFLLHINDQQHILLQMEQDIAKIERCENIMQADYLVKTVEMHPMTIFSHRKNMGLEDLDAAFAAMFAEMERKKINPSGPYLIIYHDEVFDHDNSDMEIAVQIAGGAGEHIRDLSPGFCCFATHIGPYDNLGECYAALSEWIEREGYVIAGPPFDLYVKDFSHGVSLSEYVTEVYFPIKK